MSLATNFKAIHANDYVDGLIRGKYVLDHTLGIDKDGTTLLVVRDIKQTRRPGSRKVTQLFGDYHAYRLDDLVTPVTSTAYPVSVFVVPKVGLISGNLNGVKSVADGGSKVLTAAQLQGKQVLFMANIDATNGVSIGVGPNPPGSTGIQLDVNASGVNPTSRVLLFPCPQEDLFGSNSGGAGHVSTVAYAAW